MLPLVPLDPVDYLVVGHLACDLSPEGPQLGGTAAYSALTARALGLRVGIVTAWAGDLPAARFDGIRVVSVPSENCTTFENVYADGGRIQRIHSVAAPLLLEHIPEAWRRAPIVHLGPIAQEGKTLPAAGLASSLLGVTPQGWMRCWDGDGRVRPCAWQEAAEVLPHIGAAVLSLEDAGGDENQIEAIANACRILAVTEGPAGARLYWNGDLRRFQAPATEEIDATGAGDVFAAAFFVRLYETRDPWAAARFATCLAARSVTRPGLQGIPTPEEVQSCLVEVF